MRRGITKNNLPKILLSHRHDLLHISLLLKHMGSYLWVKLPWSLLLAPGVQPPNTTSCAKHIWLQSSNMRPHRKSSFFLFTLVLWKMLSVFLLQARANWWIGKEGSMLCSGQRRWIYHCKAEEMCDSGLDSHLPSAEIHFLCVIWKVSHFSTLSCHSGRCLQASQAAQLHNTRHHRKQSKQWVRQVVCCSKYTGHSSKPGQKMVSVPPTFCPFEGQSHFCTGSVHPAHGFSHLVSGWRFPGIFLFLKISSFELPCPHPPAEGKQKILHNSHWFCYLLHASWLFGNTKETAQRMVFWSPMVSAFPKGRCI